MEHKLRIIIPVYNEGEIIRSTLDECISKVHVPHQICIVYDFVEDNTVPIVQDYIDELNHSSEISLLFNDYGHGAHNAIRKGIDTATTDYILVTMGDLSDDMQTINEMYAKMESGYDLVCGSRYMKGGQQIGGGIIKIFLSRMAGLSLHLLTGIPTRDISNNFKMYRRSFVQSIQIESTGGFEIGLEILVKAWLTGIRITEVPTTWRDRTVGQSNFKMFRWLPKYLRWYLIALAARFRRR